MTACAFQIAAQISFQKQCFRWGEIKKVIKIQSTRCGAEMCALLLGYKWCYIWHETWSQWVLSVLPLNLPMEEQKGIREGSWWSDLFPFHLFLISIRARLTFFATYQAPGLLLSSAPLSNPRGTRLIKISFISCMCFCLYWFLSSYSQPPPRRSCTNKPWHAIF